MKKRCSVYLRNSELGPSDYYRVMQYIEQLGDFAEFKINNALNKIEFQKNLNMNNGIIKKVYQVFLYIKILKRRIKALNEDLQCPPDIIIIQREIFPRYMPLTLKKSIHRLLQNTTIIWDFDDDIFLNGEISQREKSLLILHSTYIIGLGMYARSLLPEFCKQRFIIMHTSDASYANENINKIIQERKITYQNEIRIVWVGTASNLHHIDIVIEELDLAAKFLKKKGKEVVLSVVCNTPYVSSYPCKILMIENIKWSRECAKQAISKAHIGIMPLRDNQYSKGKGGFKLVQYLESGLPVISSDVGFCKEVIKEGSGYLISPCEKSFWHKTIVRIGTEENLWFSNCNEARKQYLEKFDFAKNLRGWSEIIRMDEEP